MDKDQQEKIILYGVPGLFALVILLLLVPNPNAAPDGVRVSADTAMVFQLAWVGVRSGEILEVDNPDDEQERWLAENGYSYSHFKPDTTIGSNSLVSKNGRAKLTPGYLVYHK